MLGSLPWSRHVELRLQMHRAINSASEADKVHARILWHYCLQGLLVNVD